MSELSSDHMERREILKQIIRDIHRNHDTQELKERFKQLISRVGASEIAAMEQELIAEGLPEHEIKRLCDVHVSVFKDVLNDQQRSDDIHGHPVHTFKKENRAIEQIVQELYPILAELESSGPRPHLLAGWKEKQEALLKLDRHYSRKENILFPYMEKHGISGPPSVMWSIHDDIRDALKKVSRFLEGVPESQAEMAEFIGQTVLPILKAIDEMIYKEENILFPMCMETLTEEEWSAILAQSDEIGYCLISPDRGWEPNTAAQVQTEHIVPEGNLRFNTGILTQEEISLIFNHLPVDVTFVDKDNRIKYFSNPKERIFPRTPAIIGRAVQNCHPPDSVHVVNQIVEDFESGRRDSADFWLNINDKFIYIRYFAVRNAGGEYMGTLEVTQNIKEMRNLQGEKRILDKID